MPFSAAGIHFSSINESPCFKCAQVAWCNKAVAQKRLISFPPMKCLHLSSTWGTQGGKVFVPCTNNWDSLTPFVFYIVYKMPLMDLAAYLIMTLTLYVTRFSADMS